MAVACHSVLVERLSVVDRLLLACNLEMTNRLPAACMQANKQMHRGYYLPPDNTSRLQGASLVKRVR